MPSFDPTRVVLLLVPMVLSLSFHEFAHAQVAKWLGDDTAEREGRLTLNPLSHIDPFGTLLLPAIGAMTGVPLIGWARPVPVNPSRFRRGVNMRRGHALVSAAGPLSNLLLAVIAAGILGLGGAAVAGNDGVRELLRAMLLMNVGLCVFNLLPIAPLDGSRLTPRVLDGFQARIAPFSVFILMGILMVPQLRDLLIVTPVLFLVRVLMALFGVFVL